MPPPSGTYQVAAGRPLRLHTELHPMAESSPDESPAALRAKLQRDGYLLLRQALPRAKVLAGQRRIAEELERSGWEFQDIGQLLVADSHPRPAGWSAHTGSSVGTKFDNQALMHSPEVLAVIQGEEIFALLGSIFGEPASTLDMKWLRAMSPAGDAPASGDIHMDNVYMGRGSRDLVTCWVPWCDAPMDLGGLVVLEGSNHLPGLEQSPPGYD